VIIEDNGCGFDIAAIEAASGRYRGLGLDGMRERLLLIGGTLDVESTVGAGTTIFARIPLDGQRSAA
jgi:signal transduction histidine kinase